MRPAFDRELALACERAGAVILRSSRITDIVREASTWSISISSKGTEAIAEALFVVDATGLTAPVSRKMGARVEILDEQIAIASFGNRILDQSNSRSVIKSCEYGWWYCGPVSSRTVC